MPKEPRKGKKKSSGRTQAKAQQKKGPQHPSPLGATATTRVERSRVHQHPAPHFSAVECRPSTPRSSYGLLIMTQSVGIGVFSAGGRSSGENEDDDTTQAE